MKGMTIREIAELCGVAESTVRNWIAVAKTAADTAPEAAAEIASKMERAGHGKEATTFSRPAVLAIIRAGGKGTLADLLEQNARETRPAPRIKLPSGPQLREIRMLAEHGALEKADVRALLGLPPERVFVEIEEPEAELDFGKILQLCPPSNAAGAQ